MAKNHKSRERPGKKKKPLTTENKIRLAELLVKIAIWLVDKLLQ